MRVISGEEAADAGSIVIAGRTVADEQIDLGTSRRPVASVPQGARLLDHRQVGTNVALGLPRQLRSGRRGAGRVAEMFDLVGLAIPLADRRPPELSISERHRVLLAQALVGHPELLLLDEPFFAFDPATRGRLRTEMREVLRAAGTATVLVSHHDSDVAELADRRFRLQDGRLVPPAPESP